MELSIRGDVAGAVDGVHEDTVLEGEDQGAFAAAGYDALGGVSAWVSRGVRGWGGRCAVEVQQLD